MKIQQLNVNLFLLALLVVVLPACSSSDSEVQKKYEGCRMLQQMVGQSSSSMFNMQVKVDCEAGKQACDQDRKSEACELFLKSVKIK